MTDQRKALFDELEYYITETEVEHKIQLSGRLPTVAEYWAFRRGTSGVGILIALIESVPITHEQHMTTLVAPPSRRCPCSSQA
jgi:hypothetical protein